MLLRLAMIAGLALAPTLAVAADKAAAKACAAQLAPGPRAVYDQVAPGVGPDTVIKDAIVAKLKPQVMAGKLSRAEAKESGQAAGPCLKLLQ